MTSDALTGCIAAFAAGGLLATLIRIIEWSVP